MIPQWHGVVAGVEYLHNHSPVLIHGDLKSVRGDFGDFLLRACTHFLSKANILIDNNNLPQLCDFGLVSIYFEEGSTGMTTTSAHTGTDRYLAYELLLNGDTTLPTTASDIFALACVGLEVWSFPHPLRPDLCSVAIPDLLFTTAIRPSQK